MSEMVIRLEQALRLWEDACFLSQAIHHLEIANGQKTAIPLSGPIVHYAEFRDFVLRALPNFDPLDFDRRFMGSADLSKVLGDLWNLPHSLLLWSACSRRVYHLNADIQLLFNATSVSNICWQDIGLPFEAFAISLERPILGTTLNQEYDVILFSNYQVAPGLFFYEFRLLPTSLQNYQPLSQEEINLVKDFIKRKKWHKLQAKILHLAKRLPDRVIYPCFTFPLDEVNKKAKISESILELAQRAVVRLQGENVKFFTPEGSIVMPMEGNTAARIMAGLCLFLTTKSGRQVTGRRQHQPATCRNIMGPNLITDPAEIFKVASSRKLTAGESSAFSRGLKGNGSEKSFHFRQGTWRKPPGQGCDLSAKKTIWVQPCLVRADLLFPGRLPPGTEIKLQ